MGARSSVQAAALGWICPELALRQAIASSELVSTSIFCLLSPEKDGDLRDAFDVIDTDKSGQLMGREVLHRRSCSSHCFCVQEIADALRELGKSQKQISRLA